MKVTEIVERIRLLPGAFIDSGFGQGRDAFLRQLENLTGEDESALVDVTIEKCRNLVAELAQRARPYKIPDDYIFFLEFYGGLAIDHPNYRFSIFGVGPMVEAWYASVNSDEAFPEPGRCGFLSVGLLNFREGIYKFQYVYFFLDLAGIVQKNCVIGVGPWDAEELTPSTIIEIVHVYPDMWRKIANSFIHWLDQVAETQGAFNYI